MTSTVLARVKGLLGHEALYVGLQKAIGADRLRYRCLEELKLRDGDMVIDVGCGPAYYFARLPKVRYAGFDTSPRYIEHARKRWGSEQVEFRCEVFGEQHLGELPPANAVLLLGLLHHLTDEQSRDLLRVAARALAPGGRVISVDPTFHPGQNRISRWMSANDRGEYVRDEAAYRALAAGTYAEVDGEVVSTATRVPTSHWLMRMTAPIPSEGASEAIPQEAQRSS